MNERHKGSSTPYKLRQGAVGTVSQRGKSAVMNEDERTPTSGGWVEEILSQEEIERRANSNARELGFKDWKEAMASEDLSATLLGTEIEMYAGMLEHLDPKE